MARTSRVCRGASRTSPTVSGWPSCTVTDCCGRAGRLFCVVACPLARSKYLALGGFYRRVRATRGAQVANIAAARKLAVLFYNTLRFGLTYVEQGLQRYEETYRQHSLQRLQRNAHQFGLTLVPIANAT
jgi:transposase